MTHVEAQRSKVFKKSVDFEHPASGMDHCGDCKYFLRDENACKRVRGLIKSVDWCKLFLRK